MILNNCDIIKRFTFQEQNAKYVTEFKAFLLGEFPTVEDIVYYHTTTIHPKCEK